MIILSTANFDKFSIMTVLRREAQFVVWFYLSSGDGRRVAGLSGGRGVGAAQLNHTVLLKPGCGQPGGWSGGC